MYYFKLYQNFLTSTLDLFLNDVKLSSIQFIIFSGIDNFNLVNNQNLDYSWKFITLLEWFQIFAQIEFRWLWIFMRKF